MKKSIYLLLYATIFILTSCVSTMSIKSDTGEPMGIPFYIKKAEVKQQTKYLYEWTKVSLISEEDSDDEKKVISVLAEIRIKKGQDLTLLKNLVTNLKKSKESKVILAQVLYTIDTLGTVTLHSTDIQTAQVNNVIENSWSIQSVVDYSNKYYINTKMPWFGSSTLTQKLAADGTLSEATGTTDSQIDELATAVVSLAAPFATVKAAKIAAQAIKPSEGDSFTEQELYDTRAVRPFSAGTAPAGPTYKLKIEEKGFLYTFTKIHDLKDKGAAKTPIPFNLESGMFSRENWPAVKVGSEGEDKPTINVSGSIQLPAVKE